MIDRDSSTDLNIPPSCRPTVGHLQRVLDGEGPAAALDIDEHARTCALCRSRIAAARLLQSSLATPLESPVPSGFADRILASVRDDRQAQVRQRTFLVATGLGAALAASLLLVGWLNRSPKAISEHPGNNMVQAAPETRPVRIGDEFSKVGQAILGSSRPITEPVGRAPEMFSHLANSLTPSAAPAEDFEPARRSLTELPDAARASLEPVTDTAQKAFSRLIRDFGAVQVNRPKS